MESLSTCSKMLDLAPSRAAYRSSWTNSRLRLAKKVSTGTLSQRWPAAVGLGSGAIAAGRKPRQVEVGRHALGTDRVSAPATRITSTTNSQSFQQSKGNDKFGAFSKRFLMRVFHEGQGNKTKGGRYARPRSTSCSATCRTSTAGCSMFTNSKPLTPTSPCPTPRSVPAASAAADQPPNRRRASSFFLSSDRSTRSSPSYWIVWRCLTSNFKLSSELATITTSFCSASANPAS